MSRSPLRAIVSALLLALLAAAPPAAAAGSGLSEAAGWLRGYLRIDTTNPPGNEAAAAAYLAEILHREGVPTRLLVTPEGRASLYARLQGSEADCGLLLMHHIDVVPPGPGWSTDPFAGEVRDGSLWGRGAVDVKSLGVAQLAAFLALKRSGVRPRCDVALLAVADEESGGAQGTGWLIERHPELFAGIAAAFGEGGANREINGRLLWWGVETAQKRPLWLRVTADGRGGHGSGLNPHSAMHRLIRALDRVLQLPPRYRVTAAARQYLGALVPYETISASKRFADLDAWIAPDGPRGPMRPGEANMFLDTVQVTVIEGGERINVVPAEVSARLDVRLLPDTDADEFLDRLAGALGSDAQAEVLLSAPPLPPTATDTPAFDAVRRVLADEGPVVPAFIPGFTDSRYLRQRGIPTYGLSPFRFERDVLLGIHGPDERIPLDELDRGVERMRRIVAVYAAG